MNYNTSTIEQEIKDEIRAYQKRYELTNEQLQAEFDNGEYNSIAFTNFVNAKKGNWLYSATFNKDGELAVSVWKY